MTVPHPRTGPAVAAAALVVIVGSLHPVAAAMEADDGTVDEAETEAGRGEDVDGEPAEAPEGEATTTAAKADAESAQTATQQSAPDPEPTADPEPVEEPNSQPAADPDAEPVPDPDAEPDAASAPQPDTELAPEPEAETDSDSTSTPEPNTDPESADESMSETEAELEEASDSVAELALKDSDPDSDSGSEPDAESTDESPSAPSESSSSPSPTSTSSTSGSAGSSEPYATNDSGTRSESMTPKPSPDEPTADDADAADNEVGLAVAPTETAWPKRTVEAAGATVRPLATEGLSGADLAALKSTNTSYPTPTADKSGVRAPMAAGPADREADESVPAPQVATVEGGMFDRVADVLGGAVSGGDLAGIPAAAAVPMWLMLTGLALLLVVVAGHLRWASLNPTTVSTAGRPRRPSGGTGR